MRPTILPASVTLTLAPAVAGILGCDTLTVTGDTSPTSKGWAPSVRPLTRRNAIAAIALAYDASTAPDAMIIAKGLREGDANACLALALSLPVWSKPHALREGWASNRDGWRMITMAIVANTLHAHDSSVLDRMDREACAMLDTMEAERIAKGKAAPFPMAKPAPATVEASTVEVAPVAPAKVRKARKVKA